MVEYHALCNALTMIILEYSSMKVKSDAINGRKSLPALIGKEESVLRFCNKSTCCCTSILTFPPIKLIFHTINHFTQVTVKVKAKRSACSLQSVRFTLCAETFLSNSLFSFSSS